MDKIDLPIEVNEKSEIKNVNADDIERGAEKKVCPACGALVHPEARFCPKCGVEITSAFEDVKRKDEKIKFTEQAQQTENLGKTQNQMWDKVSRGTFSKLWNHPVFTMLAVKFGEFLDAVVGFLLVICAVMLFSEGGFGAILFGLLFLVCGGTGLIMGIIGVFSRYKKAKEETPEIEAEINKKKRNLCIGIVVIIIGILFINSTGGGIYTNVKSISFDNIGPETIGELVEANVKGAEWSKQKLDGSSWLVYVEGYCPLYSEDIRIGFFYEKQEKGYREVSLQSIEFPESGECYSDVFSAGMVWASFYE